MERKTERLRWRCIRRRFLELDIMLTRFLDNGFDRLPRTAAGIR
jgi:succinate dehydrogenase flavin-adding protein (antitoxin of CptAB toxin-antitoxin module)